MKSKIVGLVVAIMIMASSAFAFPWKPGQAEMNLTLPDQNVEVLGITESGEAWGLLSNPATYEGYKWFFYNKKGEWYTFVSARGTRLSTIIQINAAHTAFVELCYEYNQDGHDDQDCYTTLLRLDFTDRLQRLK